YPNDPRVFWSSLGLVPPRGGPRSGARVLLRPEVAAEGQAGPKGMPQALPAVSDLLPDPSPQPEAGGSGLSFPVPGRPSAGMRQCPEPDVLRHGHRQGQEAEAE